MNRADHHAHAPTPTAARAVHAAGPELAVVGGYVLLTLLFTYPLVAHLSDMVVGLAVDAESHLWSYWWMRKALLELHTNPFVTTWLYYPEGASLYFYAYNVVHALLSIPLQNRFGLVVAYNLTELLGFFLAAWSAYWLARDVTGSRAASFLAGVAFAFAPTQLFHFNAGQPNLHGVEFIPLYVLCVRRWLNFGRSRWLLGAAIALALNAFSDWQFAVYLQLLTGAVLLAVLLAHPRFRWWVVVRSLAWRVASLQALFFVAVAPVAGPMYLELQGPDPYMLRSRRDTIYHSPDVLAFFIPNPEHPLWGDWALQQFERLKTPGITVPFVSLSYVVLGLAILGAWHCWQRSRFWVFCGAGFLVLSLGPQLRLLGEVTPVPLPYEFLLQFSVLRVTRAPARYVIITLLCLAVLAATGFQALQHRLNVKMKMPRPVTNRGWFGVVLAALCFELLPIPVHAAPPAAVPPFLSDGTVRGALMEMPDPSNRGMYYATVHERPVLYGELSRDNPPGPMLNYLRHRIFDADIVQPASGWRCVAAFYHITHLMVYRRKPEASAYEQQVIAHIGRESLVGETPDLALYQIPTEGISTTCLVIADEQGWDRLRSPTPEQPDELPYRWMHQEGRIGVLRRTDGPVTLHFEAHSFAIPRQVGVYHGERLVAHLEVGKPQHHTVILDLPRGLSWLDLRSVEPALSPADYGYQETEPISIGLAQLWAEEEEAP
ncbi:MAG: hypothetical protein HC884_14405 [Chloroflexaceae bacterium]|nr:hypothetical protein [Chloroflexaceae bacterium]